MATATRWAAVALMTLSMSAPGTLARAEEPATLVGEVTDTSGAALPGVYVRILRDTQLVVAAVTDSTGRYEFGGLAPATYRVEFELSGFEVAVDPSVTLDRGGRVGLDRRLSISGPRETVDVVGLAPPPPPPVVVQEPDNPVIKPLPPLDPTQFCGPRLRSETTLPLARIAGHRDMHRQLFAQGDVLVIDAGRASGVDVGQHLVSRRLLKLDSGHKKNGPAGEQLTGLLQITAADDFSAEAVVVYSCYEISIGDDLVAFDIGASFGTLPAAVGSTDQQARVILADDGAQLSGPRRLIVIDRGWNQGSEPGQRVAFYRAGAPTAGRPKSIAEGVVVAVQEDSATVRIDYAVEAIQRGDRAAARVK